MRLTPHKLITRIGLIFHFLNTNNAIAKIIAPIQLICVKTISFSPNTTVLKIDKPAAAINATTVGRKLESTLCNVDTFLYR